MKQQRQRRRGSHPHPHLLLRRRRSCCVTVLVAVAAALYLVSVVVTDRATAQLEEGLISVDAATGRLSVHSPAYHALVVEGGTATHENIHQGIVMDNIDVLEELSSLQGQVAALKAANDKLRQQTCAQSITPLHLPASGAADIEHFAIRGKDYVAIANSFDAVQGASTTSDIYRWDPVLSAFSQDPVQSIPTFGASDIEHFSIGGADFLAVANSQPRTGSTSANESHIFAWNQTAMAFELHQELPSMNAAGIEVFEIDGQAFLAVANSHDPAADNGTYSQLLVWNSGAGMFEHHQNLVTYGARSFHAFSINASRFLIVANENRLGNGIIPSVLYRFNATTRKFVEHQQLTTIAAVDWVHVSISGQHMLICAYNNGIVSRVFSFDALTQQFQLGDPLSTDRASSLAFTVLDGTPHLAVASYGPTTSVVETESSLFRWDADSGHFLPTQIFVTTGATSTRFVRLTTGVTMLAFANSRNTNNVGGGYTATVDFYVWDGCAIQV